MCSEGVLALSGQTSLLQAGGHVQNHGQQTENQLVQILCHQHHPGNIPMERFVSETEQPTHTFVCPSRKETWRRLKSFFRNRLWSCRVRLSGGIGSSCRLSPHLNRTLLSLHTSPASGLTPSWFHCTTSCLSFSTVCISFSCDVRGS